MSRNREFDGCYGPVLHFRLQNALMSGGQANLEAIEWMRNNPGITTGIFLGSYSKYPSRPTNIPARFSAQPITEKPAETPVPIREGQVVKDPSTLPWWTWIRDYIPPQSTLAEMTSAHTVIPENIQKGIKPNQPITKPSLE